MKLWDHQLVAIERARQRKHLAIFYEPGTGKTATMVNILREEFNKEKRIMRVLILAPLSVCHQWRTEILNFSKIPENVIHILTQPGKTRTKILEQVRSAHRGIVVTNYEGVQIKGFYEQLLAFGPEIVVLDESQRIKDSSSVRAKKIYPLCFGAKRRFLLTGTPILNSLLDIYGQYRALDPQIFDCNFWSFRNRYFVDANAGMPAHVYFPDWIPKPDAAEMIGRVLAKTSVQAKKEDCLTLPPLLDVPVEVTLSDKQRRAYKQMEKTFVAEFQGQVMSAEFAMTKTIRLQQLLSGFLVPDRENGEDPKDATWLDDVPRLKALSDLLGTLGSEKVIVWTTFRPTYKRIGKVCEGLGLTHTFLTGEQSATEKQQAIEDFTKGAAQVLISNPAAGGVGINLQEAKYAVYYNKGYSLEHYIQSKARNYRGGSEQHTSVTHYHLVAKNTLDEVIQNALMGKQSVADAVLGWAKKITVAGS